MVLFLLSLLTRNTFLSSPPPTSYYRALFSVFMSQNCSSVSLSNIPYHSEKPSADLCHLYGDTYQSAAAAFLTTHSAVYKIIMDLVRCGNIQFFSAVNLCNTAVAETKTR